VESILDIRSGVPDSILSSGKTLSFAKPSVLNSELNERVNSSMGHIEGEEEVT